MRALLPMAASMVLGLMTGLTLLNTGGTLQDAMPVMFLGDLIITGVLIAMIKKAPKPEEVAEHVPAEVTANMKRFKGA
ncbi:MAG: hypothetical protein O7B35_05595 [Deltaproteobacteria bacterium]|nr:hypothetical protein [Deltaproteobacteria bacterium]